MTPNCPKLPQFVNFALPFIGVGRDGTGRDGRQRGGKARLGYLFWASQVPSYASATSTVINGLSQCGRMDYY